jgi:hypothetical protein
MHYLHTASSRVAWQRPLIFKRFQEHQGICEEVEARPDGFNSIFFRGGRPYAGLGGFARVRPFAALALGGPADGLEVEVLVAWSA